jgi:hypothetical protein
MYKIIGADGKEYGPITTDQLRVWIAEGRANRHTRVLVDGTTEWKQLSDFPELFPPEITPTGPPPLSSLPATGSLEQEKVNGPAIGLMVLAGLNLVLGAGGLLMNLLGSSMMMMHNGPQQAWANMFSGTLGVVSNSLGILISGVIFYGGLKMKRLENHGLAMAASILSIIPCTSPCCLLGIPVGIWALVVLTKPEVKSAFH